MADCPVSRLDPFHPADPTPISREQAQEAWDRALKGVALRADFALETGKGVTLAKRGNVFATQRIHTKDGRVIDAQLNGKRHRMTVGSQIPLVTHEEECVISCLGGDAARQPKRFNMTCNPKYQADLR